MHAAEDKFAEAKRTVRKNWQAASDYVDDVSVAVKKQPFKTIAITLGVAFGAGALAVWLSRPK